MCSAVITAGFIAFVPSTDVTAEAETVQKSISTVNITTEDLVDPPCTPLPPPSGMWGNSITDNSYVNCTVEYVDPNMEIKTILDSEAKVKIRGNTSALGDKKPYKLKLSKKQAFGTDTKSKKWVLLNSGTDLTFLFSNFTSEYCGMEWQPSFEYVNVNVNGDYKGCYILCEAVEQMVKDLDIEDNGFIIENDAYWWKADESFTFDGLNEHMAFTFKEPEAEDFTDEQKSAIADKMSAAAAKIMDSSDYEYQSDIDLTSAVSWYLAKDYQANSDAAGSNMYWYAESLDAPLKLGPVWDFDCDYNTDYTNRWSNIHYRDINFGSYLFEKDSFRRAYREQFEKTLDLRTALPEYVNDFYNTYGKSLQESWEKDAERWNTTAETVSVVKNHLLSWYEKRQKYMNSVTADWNKKIDIAEADAQMSAESVVCTGRPVMPELTLTYNGETLVKDRDYTFVVKDHTDPGKAIVCISGAGKFTGETRQYYYIVPAKQTLTAESNTEGAVDLSWNEDPLADGYHIQASLTKSFSAKKTYVIEDRTKTSGTVCGLTPGKTFYVRIRSYKVIDGKKIPGASSDIVAVTTKINIADADAQLSSDKVAYTGRPVMPELTITYNGETLEKDVDYTFVVKDHIAPGKAIVCISGIGRFSGTARQYYYIVPSRQALTAESDIEGTINLSWKEDPLADGYQIEGSLTKSFLAKKTYVIEDRTKTSGIVCGLTSGKTFYVRIRSYKIIDGKKIPGVSSDIVAVVTK